MRYAASTRQTSTLRSSVSTRGGAVLRSATGSLPLLSISSPVAYQVFQRNASNKSDISITGINQGVADVIEASFNGGAYADITSVGVTGTFTGTLPMQSAGQGTLTLRIKNTPTATATISNLGIGDVFVIAGQSNASGRGTNEQTYSHASLKAGMFGNDYLWKELTDWTDDGTNQVDVVSDDGIGNYGSVWPLLATSILSNNDLPVAFIPCALNGTLIAQWQPGANHQDRTTLYGSMIYRALNYGGSIPKAVLWWQGESDASGGTTQVQYNARLDILANAITADIGCKIIPCKIQNCTGVGAGAQAVINAAIGEAWGDNTNVLTGPDLTGLTTDNDYHLTSDANLSSAATLWWNAIKAALGW